MGQEILYCYKCQTRLLGSEFEKGKAFKVGGKAACGKCVQDLLAVDPEAQADYERAKKIASSSRVPAAASESGSGKWKPAVRPAPAAPAAPPLKPRNTVILVAIVVGALLLIAVATLMSSHRTTVVHNDPAPAPPSPPAPPRLEDPKPPAVSPTSAFAAELREIDERMRTGLAAEEFRPVSEFLAQARTKRNTPEWLNEIDLRIPLVEARVRRAAQPLREKALEALKRKDDAEVRKLRERIGAWGFPTVVDDFDRALAEAVAAPPPPPAGASVPGLVAYADAIAGGWMNMSWDVDLNLTANDFPFEGNGCIHVVPKKKWGALCLVFDKPIDTREYPWVAFALRTNEDVPWIGVTVWDKAKPVNRMVNVAELGGGFAKPREWKRFVVPIATFAPPDPKVTAIAFQFQEPLDRLAASIDGISFLKGASGDAPVSAAPRAVWPEGSFVVWDDGYAPGCRDHSWSGSTDYAATSPVFEGTKSIGFAPKQMAAGLYLGIDNGLDSSVYTDLTLALNLAEDYVHCGVALYADGKPAGAVNFSDLGGYPKTGEWKKFTIPVSRLNPSARKITGVVIQVYKTGTRPLIYVDSVAFLRGGAGAAPPAPTAEAYRARWTAAAAKAALRDYAGAQKELEDASAALKDEATKAEAAADLELVKLAAQVPAEAAKAIDKFLKGQKVHLQYLNLAGERESVEGSVVASEGPRLTILRDGGSLDLPVAELLPASLAEIFRARGDRKATDGRAAAAFCLFEGDAEAAKKHWEQIPAKYLAATRPVSESEAAARRTFWMAETDFAAPRTRGSAIEKYTSLLNSESSAFASRLKPYLAARLEAARDTVFLAEDMTAAGSFQQSGGAKMDVTWSSAADSAPSAAKANYVEVEFAALPGAPYKAWIWAGACCLETFDFSVQASELASPNPKNSKEPIPCEPGGDAALTPKAPSLTLRKWHAQHGGPKEPQKWDWFPVALPKYETGGPKRLRVLTSQQGFSVGAIVVSSSRKDTPRETEIKELEKLRMGGRKGPALGVAGYILHEWWNGIDGNTVEDLQKAPAFAQKPSGSAMRDLFEGPRDMGDRYGARYRGFVHPPVSGAYTFWIASDDGGELFLSTDDSPLKKRSIARCYEAAGVRDWNRVPTCKSAPVVLAAGKRYYIEALHKEGGGNDHCAVGWTLPDGTEERPIPGVRLSAWNTAAPPPPSPPGLTFFRGYNINGQPITIDGRKWEGKGSQTLGTAGEGFENQSVPLNPPTDEARATMIRSSAYQKGSMVAKIYQVPPGSYQVYLYVWEDNAPEVFDIFLQNKEVVKGYNSGPAGHWEKLGPWTTTSNEGVIEIRTSGGAANLSGIELWKVGK